jgi:hypothetical protein
VLPQVTIEAEGIKKHQLVKLTNRIIYSHIAFGVFTLLAIILGFGGMFAMLEGWSIGEGVYFTYGSIMSIGYGDYILRKHLSRSIFVWFTFTAIFVSTYFASMVAEVALDQWSVTIDTIEKRVDRYETKAKWKKRYAKQSGPRLPTIENHAESTPLLIPNRKSTDASSSDDEIPNESARAFSISVSRGDSFRL